MIMSMLKGKSALKNQKAKQLLKKNYTLYKNSFTSILRTLKTTSNYWVVPIYLFYPEKRLKVKFYGYAPLEVAYDEYWKLRDIISQGYKIRKSDGINWQVFLDNQYVVYGDKRLLEAFSEPLADTYKVFNYEGKIVLDVGGFMGETAVLFASWGAKRVIIYEPVPCNIDWIYLNSAKNDLCVNVYKEGVGEKDCFLTVKYDSINTGFGLSGMGQKCISIKVRSCFQIITDSGADIAKFDCEGAESSLLSVPNETLRLIREWIIECHSLKIEELLLCKFREAGFRALIRRSHLVCVLTES